ncbi:MAG: VTT domain-containing protein [Aquabacterium sp.]
MLWPSLRFAAWATALFAAGLLAAREFAGPARELLQAHAVLGVVAFVATSAFAVLMPMVSNLPLVPLAVLAWGPWWTALLLLAGWVLGAGASFMLGRRARGWIERRLPSVKRHADIDRLIDPERRMLSLALLRATFPVDVLSYALGMFSRSTTLAQNMASTALGAAPFALFFAWVPAFDAPLQLAVLAVSVLAFVLHVRWVLRRRG